MDYPVDDPDMAEPQPGSEHGPNNHWALCHHCEDEIVMAWVHEDTGAAECAEVEAES